METPSPTPVHPWRQAGAGGTRNIPSELGKGRGSMLGYCEARFQTEGLFVITLMGRLLVPKYCLRFC